MLGERVLGKELAAAEALKANDGLGGGALQLGHRILGGGESSPTAVPLTATAKPATASKNRVVPAARAKAAATVAVPVDQTTFTELEVEGLLGEDPNVWPRIAEAEGQRAEGPRAAVVQMLLDVRDLATEPAMTTKIIAELEKLLAARPAVTV